MQRIGSLPAFTAAPRGPLDVPKFHVPQLAQTDTVAMQQARKALARAQDNARGIERILPGLRLALGAEKAVQALEEATASLERAMADYEAVVGAS